MRPIAFRFRPKPLAGAVSLAFALAAAVTLSACTTPVLKPSVDVPPKFAASVSADEPEAAWWDSYHDPVLSDLVRRAARENRDVKMAAERVRAARAGETVSRSFLFPSLNASASGLKQSSGYDAETRQSVPNARVAAASLDVSWEVDLSGRLRAGAAASKADRVATEDMARGVRLLVMSDVATNYFTLTGTLRQLQTLRAIADAQDETLRLVTARERAGLATRFDVERAQSDAERAHAAIPPLETLYASSRNRIAVLLGDQAFNAARIVPSQAAAVVPPTRAGQPAELLERRPDLLAAQAQLEAANARRQQAVAEWFPRLFLGAAFGRQGVELNGGSLGATHFTNAAALLAMPIFNAGRTGAINEQAAASQSEAVLRYEAAIVTALEDVENAVTTLDNERNRATSLHASADAANAALAHARSLYQRGQIDLLPLLDAQRAQLSAQMGANDSDTQLMLDSVQLYKALGGGWEAFEPAPATAQAKPAPQS